MRILLLSSLTALGLSCLCQAESLKDTYNQALENDHTFKAAEAAYRAGQQSKRIGRAGLLPQISASASKTRTFSEADQPLFGDQITVVSVEATFDNEAYSVSLEQALFNLNAWHNYRRGNALSGAASAQFHAAEQDLAIRTAEAYFAVLQAADSLETSRAEENAVSHQLEQTKQRFEVGLTAITEVHEAQARYDSAVAQRLADEGNMGIAFESLEQITGQSYKSLSPLQTEFAVAMPDPMEREDWVKSALENNYQLKAASKNAKAAKQGAKAARANHFPTVNLSAGYSDSFNQGGLIPQELEREEQRIGVTLNVPLFSGGGTSASRRQAYAQADQSREQFLQNQRDVVQQTRSLHLQVVTSVATVKARKQAIKSNQSALNATQAGYEVGTRDLVDVLNAQRNLYSAQRDYYNALYEYILRTLRLKQTAGLLSPADINQLDTQLDKNKKVMRF